MNALPVASAGSTRSVRSAAEIPAPTPASAAPRARSARRWPPPRTETGAPGPVRATASRAASRMPRGDESDSGWPGAPSACLCFVHLAVDAADLSHPSPAVCVLHVHDLGMVPVKVIGDEGYLLVQLPEGV